MKNVLITGGAGFIGTNLARTLLAAGYHIHILTEQGSSLWRLTDILKNIQIHEVDLIDFGNVNKLIATVKPEVILHLASFGGFPHQQDQQTIYDVNVSSTINLVNACKKTGFDCFINTGSSSEYGIKETPMKESDILEPISDYGVAKAAATNFCLKEALVNKLPIYTIRPFSAYGDFEAMGRLIPTILVNALTDQPIHLSNPHNVRDYIYIDDITRMYLEIIRKTPASAHIFNAGTGIQSTIQEVVNTVQVSLGKKLQISWGTHEHGGACEPKHWRADVTQAKDVLNWRPHDNLSLGINKSLSWFKNHLNLYPKENGIYAAQPTNNTGTTSSL